MAENYVIPLSIVTVGNEQEHPLYSCPESAQGCIAVVKLFSVKEGGRTCDRADNTSSRFQPRPPNTPSDSQKQEILAKSDVCRGVTGGNRSETVQTNKSSNTELDDFKLIGDSYTAKGEKREIWGQCNNGTHFTGSKWKFDNYWTVTAKTTVSESGLTMDSAVRKACRGR